MGMTFFKLGVEAMANRWKRFVYATQGFPWCMFDLLDKSMDEFIAQYNQFREQLSQCECCVDVEFSRVLLETIPCQEGASLAEDVAAVKAILKSISTRGPLSTDLVECFHGYTQNILHRWRGARVTDNVAQERVFWCMVTSAWSKFKSWVWDRYMDKSFRNRMAHFGTRSGNQYKPKSDQTPKPKKSLSKLTFASVDRMMAFSQTPPPLRKLCGRLLQLHNTGFYLPHRTIASVNSGL